MGLLFFVLLLDYLFVSCATEKLHFYFELTYSWDNGWKEYMKFNSQYKCITIEGEDNPANLGTAIEDNIEISFNLFVRDNIIVVENATDEILVYDAMGRIVGRDVARNVCTITVNTTGVYIVRVGNVAKRVVVN